MSTATTPSKRLYPTNAQPVPMSRWLFAALGTTVGSKYVVALTGLLLTGFVTSNGDALGRPANLDWFLDRKQRSRVHWPIVELQVSQPLMKKRSHNRAIDDVEADEMKSRSSQTCRSTSCSPGISPAKRRWRLSSSRWTFPPTPERAPET